MSQKGVSFFYGSFSPYTACREIERSEKKVNPITVGEFKPKEDLLVLDLEMDIGPGLDTGFSINFHSKNYAELIRDYSSDISQSILGVDENEYLPTQFLTDIVRRSIF